MNTPSNNEVLLRSLQTHSGELGKHCYYYRDSKGRFAAIKYELLPEPYNQLGLIRQSSYYLHSNNRSSLVFRDGTDGVPDIFDISIRRLYQQTNKTDLIDPWEWVNEQGNYPRHMKNVHSTHTEWR